MKYFNSLFQLPKTLAGFVAIVATTSLFAQKSIDILTISATEVAPSTYDVVNSEQVRESKKNIILTVPIPLSEKTIIYNNLNYYNFKVSSNQQFENGGTANLNLHGFLGRFGIVQKLNDKNGFQLLAVPRFMSDLNRSSESQWQMGGIALYEHKFNDKLKMRYGAMYNQEFFGHHLVPLVYLDWKVNEKLSVEGMLPVYLKVKYQHNERLQYGISYLGLTTTYRLGEENFNNDYIVREGLNFALYQRYHVGHNFHLETRLGYAIGRHYDQFSKDDKVSLAIPLKNFNDNRAVKSPAINTGAFLNVRLVYSLPLN